MSLNRIELDTLETLETLESLYTTILSLTDQYQIKDNQTILTVEKIELMSLLSRG